MQNLSFKRVLFTLIFLTPLVLFFAFVNYDFTSYISPILTAFVERESDKILSANTEKIALNYKGNLIFKEFKIYDTKNNLKIIYIPKIKISFDYFSFFEPYVRFNLQTFNLEDKKTGNLNFEVTKKAFLQNYLTVRSIEGEFFYTDPTDFINYILKKVISGKKITKVRMPTGFETPNASIEPISLVGKVSYFNNSPDQFILGNMIFTVTNKIPVHFFISEKNNVLKLSGDWIGSLTLKNNRLFLAPDLRLKNDDNIMNIDLSAYFENRQHQFTQWFIKASLNRKPDMKWKRFFKILGCDTNVNFKVPFFSFTYQYEHLKCIRYEK